VKILIVTPLSEEKFALVQGMQKQGCHGVDIFIGKLSAASFPEKGLLIAQCGHGKAQAALQTQHLIDNCSDVDLVICMGAAGALAEDIAIGDAVVATRTIEHDYILRFVSRPSPCFEGCDRIIEELRQVGLANAGFQVQFGCIASGDEDVIEVDRAKQLHQATGALAVAWEGAGVARACAFNQIPFIEMRGVTDTANQGAAADFDTNLQMAMNNLALLLTAWLHKQ
jgi:adenosylhomocysteine nucleosidase